MTITADLDTLRRYVGAVSTNDDDMLESALAAATAWVAERVYPDQLSLVDPQTAILLLSTRLYQRRKSPEGTAGFGADGVVVRVIANDPDISRLLERHLDTSRLGIG